MNILFKEALILDFSVIFPVQCGFMKPMGSSYAVRMIIPYIIYES